MIIVNNKKNVLRRKQCKFFLNPKSHQWNNSDDFIKSIRPHEMSSRAAVYASLLYPCKHSYLLIRWTLFLFLTLSKNCLLNWHIGGQNNRSGDKFCRTGDGIALPSAIHHWKSRVLTWFVIIQQASNGYSWMLFIER